MKRLSVLLFFLALFFTSHAQNQNKITGKVFDAYTGHPLPGVNIRLSSGEGTTTDKNGDFSILCYDTTSVTVSHLSYETYYFKPKKQSTLKIGMIPASYNLNEVSINTSRFEANRNLTQPRAISVITPRQVSREDELSFDKVLNLEPGVFSSAVSVPGSYGNGISGLSSSLMIRGYIGDRMAGGAKMYLNGIPLTDAEGKASYSDVDFSVVGQTEIIKGPSSSLYGSGIGGVVKMSVLQPKPLSTRISEQFITGSYGLYRSNTRVESATNNSSIILNYGHQYYDGWIKGTNSKQDFVTMAGTFRPSDRQTIFVYSSYTSSVGSIDKSSVDSADFYNKIKPESGDTISIKDKETTENYRIGISHNYQFSKHVSNMTSIFTSGTVGGGHSYGERTEFNLSFGNEKISVNGIIGNELQKTTSSSIKYNKLTTGENGALNTFEDYTAFQNSVFTEWAVKLPYHILVTAGASYNFIEFGIVDHLGYPDNPAKKKSNTGFKRFDPVLTPSFTVSKTFLDTYSAYFNYSQGYQPYGMSKTINIPYLGLVNNDLKPERGTQYELGTKGSFLKKRLAYQLAVFYMDISDKVTTQSVYKPNGSILYSWYTNSGHQINKGLELSATYALINDRGKFVSSVQPFISFTYSDFYFKDFKSDNNNDKNTVDYSGKKALVPPVLFNAGIDVAIKWGFYLNTTFRYVDKRPGDYANEHYAKAYSTFSATLGYRKTFFNSLSVNVAVVGNNLTNELYYYGGGSSITPIGEAYIPAPYNATYYGKVGISYKF